MSILTEQAYPLPDVIGGENYNTYASAIRGLTKLELFTLHAMSAVIPSYNGVLTEDDYFQIARVSRLIARETLDGLEKTKLNE